MQNTKDNRTVSIYSYSGKLLSLFPSTVSIVALNYQCTEDEIVNSCNSYGNQVICQTNQIKDGVRCIWTIENFNPEQLPPLVQNTDEFVFLSAKVFDGFSATFRQWRAADSHCSFMHSYLVSFKVWFEGSLDDKNWTYDFGNFKRNGLKSQLSHWFDHTTIVSIDDPELSSFVVLHKKKVLDLRIVSSVGCERYAELVFNIINSVVEQETSGRVKVQQVEVFEHDKNSAIYRRQ